MSRAVIGTAEDGDLGIVFPAPASGLPNPVHNFQLFIDNILVLTLPAAATPNGTVGFQVKGTSGTFDEIVVN